MGKSKHCNTLGKSDIILIRTKRPKEYHCKCKYCKNFLGEMYNTETNQYYSNRIRKGYYVDKAGDHLDVGQFVGYRWAIQNLTNEGGLVFDPTVGSGTAVVEAVNNGRKGIGIELEYPIIAQKNVLNQFADGEAIYEDGHLEVVDQAVIYKGNAIDILMNWEGQEADIDLIINGTPYPANGSISSDAPQRGDKTFNYMHSDNMGLTKGKEWEQLVRDIYRLSVDFLKKGGYFVIIIKDMVRNKQIFNLHKLIIDIVLEECPELEYVGYFIHRHIPTTMFINTYPKMYPGVQIPIHQTGIVLRKTK